jgi:hypothetical protein
MEDKSQEIIARLKALNKKYDRIKAEIKEVKAMCTHPNEYLYVKKNYLDSGYDYPAETHYSTNCSVCGVRIKYEVVVHNR